MTLDDWYKLSLIVGPLLTAVLTATAAIYASRAKAKQAADEKWRQGVDKDIESVRGWTHEHARRFQGLPTVLRPHFVERGEWDEAQKAGDDIHKDHSERIRSLEQRR